jgi:fructokinase
MRIAVAGEALIDFTSTGTLAFQGREGGSPLNTAVACARLGQPTAFLTALSNDLFGERLLQHMQRNGVDTRFVVRSGAPSMLAFVEHAALTNRYAFLAEGSADSGWAPDPLPELPASCTALHIGSISLLREPAASRIVALAAASVAHRLVVLDPNVRESLIADMSAYRERFRGWLPHTSLLKLSDEDLAQIAPQGGDEAIAGWLDEGPYAVVVTRGAQGATLYRAGHAPLSVPAPPLDVADTVGAGDTFSAGLSVGLLEQGVERPGELPALSDAQWQRTLVFAAAAAGLNCTRPGADPPTRDELRRFLNERSGLG